jgi:hypothetical protein
MAKHLDVDGLRELLQSDESVERNSFEILQRLCRAASESQSLDAVLELVLRALERREAFGENQIVLDSLVRAVGLYPYADTSSFDVREMLAYEYHRPLGMPEQTVFHRAQADVYRLLLAGENVILSAPTSFGKSLIIDAMIASKQFQNVAVVVPTLALIDETRRRLSSFRDYKVVTHNGQRLAEKNIFVLTQERVNGFENLPPIEFFVIDEFYKLGLEMEESRCISLNQAFYTLRKGGGQFYLLGPNIERLPEGIEDGFHCTFVKTNYVTVVSEQVRISPGDSAIDRLVALAKRLEDPTLIFCSSPNRVNEVAELFIDEVGSPVSDLRQASDWVAENFHPEWIFGRALSHGIGLHHGRLPRALAQYAVRKFNDGHLRYLICTSTLIEGVNTKAKNVIIYDNKLARRKLDYFTFNNIKGRSGRMFQHFIGKVFLFHEPPSRELPFVDIPIFTQGDDTPKGLLVQLDDEDLTDSSRERLTDIIEQDELPMEVIKANASIDPEHQIELAREIGRRPKFYSTRLAWSGYPTWEELSFACGLIWQNFVRTNQRRWGVSSGRQLAFKLMRIRNHSTRELVDLEMESNAQLTPTQAVESVLEFERHWASFEAPRLLMALSRIQESVLAIADAPTGDYSFYASQIENLFSSPAVAALDEYGIPTQIGNRLVDDLEAEDDLDDVLAELRDYHPAPDLFDEFEQEMIGDAQRAL